MNTKKLECGCDWTDETKPVKHTCTTKVTLSCGCQIIVPRFQTGTEKKESSLQHEQVCPAYAAFKADRRIAHAKPKSGISRRAWERGDDERHIVDGYWGEGTYDSEFTTDDMIDEAMS